MPRNSSLRWSMSGTRQGSGLQFNARRSPGAGKTERKMNMFGGRVSTATCLGFVVLQFLLYACKAEAGEILIAPQTQHLLLGVDESATFFCQAVGVDALWSINGETVRADGTDSDLIAKGWTFDEVRIDHTVHQRHNIHNMTLQIPSRMEFNNTRIECVGIIHDPAYSDPVFLIIKEIYLSAASGNIFAPALLYTIINESTSLSCDAVGINTFWGINGSTVNDEGDAHWTEMGFRFVQNVTHDPIGSEHFHRNTLQVLPQKRYNNTVITCAVVDTSNRPMKSDTIKIIVMGAPSSPVPVPVFDRPGVVTLEWDIPFSWPDYPVQTYDVVASNRPDLNRNDVNETSVQFMAGDSQQECEEIEFKVRASSDLGDGEFSSVIAGFPIEPQLMDNSIDGIEVSSQGNKQPQASMKIKLPRVCSYQSTRYTITIRALSDKSIISSPVTRGPFNGTVTSDIITFSEDLEWGKMYEITVEFASDVLSEPLMAPVVKSIHIEPPLPPATAGSLLPSAQQAVPTQYIIIGGVAGGIVLLLLVIVIIIVITAAYVRKQRTMRSWSPSSNGKRPMVTNPIYDGGPVYETIPPGPRPPLRLHSNSESSNITATSSVPPTPTSPLPPVPPSMESPYAYAPNQVDPAYAQPHRNGHMNFSFEETSYMIMSAVQNATAGKRLSEGEESNLDQDGDPSSARYVPEPRQPYASASMV